MIQHKTLLTLSSNAATALFQVNQWSLFFHQWSPKPLSIVMNVKTLLLSCDLYLQTSTKLGMIYSVTNQLSRNFGNLFYWTQIGKKGWSSKKGIVIKLVYVFKSIDYAWSLDSFCPKWCCVWSIIHVYSRVQLGAWAQIRLSPSLNRRKVLHWNKMR